MGMGARQDCQSVLLLLLAPRIIRGFSMVHEEAGQQVGIISHPQQPVNSSNMCQAMIKVSQKHSIEMFIVYYLQVLEGSQFEVLCQTDSYYEFCIFVSPMGQRCEFEWRRKVSCLFHIVQYLILYICYCTISDLIFSILYNMKSNFSSELERQPQRLP